MKRTLIYIVALLALVSCQKDPEIPIVSLTVSDKVEAEWLTANLSGAATANTKVDNLFVQVSTDEGFGAVQEFQAAYNKGQFVAVLTNLIPQTTYYYRYRAANKLNAFNDQTIHSFKTKDLAVPRVNTTEVINITALSAICGGNVTSDGGLHITERGICYATTSNPTISNTKVTSGTGAGSFSCNLTGLTDGTTYYVRAYAINSKGTNYGEEKSFTTTKSGGGTESGHEYVDLGLSVKWANMNVGATKVEEYGDYFAWGETSTKETYNWSTYKWMAAGQSSWKYINKYTYPDGQTSASWYSGSTFIGDNKTTLEAEDDAAQVNWGGNWRMPTHAEQEELYNNCTVTWTTNYQGTGVAGRIFTSNKTGYTDKSIFLPAAGFRDCTNLYGAGSSGFYWFSSLFEDYSDYAWFLFFYSDSVYTGNYNRYYGFSVRPVCQ